MSVTCDIFNPQVSKVAKGLEGKTIMVYGGNNLGKSLVASKLSKPYFLLCESGLNAISGVAYNRVNNWADFKKIVKQFTSKATVDKARELYNTIVIDEVYAASIFCQDFVIATYGQGALTLGDGTGKVNLYQMYEKEFFRMVNLLLSCNYTVMFIAHEQEKEGYITPKGDKRCIAPIIDNCDFVVYLTANGKDENGKVIPSTGHLAQTERFFARSRFTHCPTVINPYSAENLEKAIIEAIEAEERESGIPAVSYDEQKAMNTSENISYEELMDKISTCGQKLAAAGYLDAVTEIVENVLGAGQKVSACTKKQMDAMTIIYDDLKDKACELGVG